MGALCRCGDEREAFKGSGVGLACARSAINPEVPASGRQRRIVKRQTAAAKILTLIGLNIQDNRLLRGMTQEELAARSGIGSKTISSYECGARITKVRVAHLAALCAVFGVTLVEFFTQIEREQQEAGRKHYSTRLPVYRQIDGELKQ